MKHRYIVRTFVEATTPQEAIKLAKRTNPHDVFLDTDVWKEQNWALKESDKKPLGYETTAR